MIDLSTLKASVEKSRTVSASALALIKGFAAQLGAAIAAALSAGASPEELAELKALAAQLDSDADALAAAVVANTPATPVP